MNRLYDALARSVTVTPWWRRWIAAVSGFAGACWRGAVAGPWRAVPLRRRSDLTIAAAACVAVAFSTVGLAATSLKLPEPGGGIVAAGDEDEAGRSESSPGAPANPSPAPAVPPSQTPVVPGTSSPVVPGTSSPPVEPTIPSPGTSLPIPDNKVPVLPEPTVPDPTRPAPCQEPLTVVAAPDVAPSVERAAGSMADGECPAVAVQGKPTSRKGTQLSSAPKAAKAPDVWIPSSSLWLRQAGQQYRPQGSIARSPVVMAFPKPIYDKLEPGFPAWAQVYVNLKDKKIPRMNMPNVGTTTEGALALSGMYAAMGGAKQSEHKAAALKTTDLRNHISDKNADVEALLGKLAASRSAGKIGIFPATEQKLLRHNARNPAVKIVRVGMYDGNTEADYPLGLSKKAAANKRLSAIADKLRDRLVSRDAQGQFAKEGFRPPKKDRSKERGDDPDKNRWPDYPPPIKVPDGDDWSTLIRIWTT